ncbi:MAG: DUF4926 domain-containing protein, partial [Candidatus Paceibacterota bacterium]
YKDVVLRKNIPEYRLKKGDVATIVAHHPLKSSEDGYSLEVFNAVGETIAVVTVPESDIENLKESDVLSVRSMSGV